MNSPLLTLLSFFSGPNAEQDVTRLGSAKPVESVDPADADNLEHLIVVPLERVQLAKSS